MKPVARLGDSATCTAPGAGPIDKPGTAAVLVNGTPISLLADLVVCPASAKHQGDVVGQGAELVLAGGLPISAETFTTVEGGVIVGPGSPDVLVGGPVFGLPAGIVVKGDGPFKNKVVRDLWFLWNTEAGKALFRRIARSGKTVTIEPLQRAERTQLALYKRMTDWERFDLHEQGIPLPGSHTSVPGNPGHAEDATVYLDPDPSPDSVYTTNPDGSDGPMGSAPPQVVLFHELEHAASVAEGRARPPAEQDPNPPFPNQPGVKQPQAESDAIQGENALRDELGLPRRKAQAMRPVPPEVGPPDMRPGEDP